MERVGRTFKHYVKNLPYAIAYNEKDDYGNICGVKFKYFKSEKKRRRWCGKLEKRPEFAGYCGRYNFERGKARMTREEAKAMIEGLGVEEKRILYGFTLALHADDMLMVQEMEEAQTEDDIERVKKLSESAIERWGEKYD